MCTVVVCEPESSQTKQLKTNSACESTVGRIITPFDASECNSALMQRIVPLIIYIYIFFLKIIPFFFSSPLHFLYLFIHYIQSTRTEVFVYYKLHEPLQLNWCWCRP